MSISFEEYCKTENMHEVLAEWDYSVNGDVTPDKVTSKSACKVGWKCKNGHTWVSAVYHRANGRKCPYCSNKKAWPGFNDLEKWAKDNDRPDILNEWDYEKNGEMTPANTLPHSNKKVWWKCSSGHSWEAKIETKVELGNSCPYCANYYIQSGFNDLKTLFPKVAKEWDYEKNGDLRPENVGAGTDKKVYWICSKDNSHKWQASVVSRTHGTGKKKPLGCPVCSNKQVLTGFNDLATWCKNNNRENLLAEWDYEKNGDITPETILYGSNTKVNWCCERGHRWNAKLDRRTRAGQNCPKCNNERQTSFPEYAIEYYLSAIEDEIVHSYPLGNRQTLDLYIPSKKTGIEYDGSKWHKGDKNVRNDLRKNLKCKELGITLYRIREDIAPLNDTSVDVSGTEKDIGASIKELLELIYGRTFDVDVERDRKKIEELREYIDKKNSVAAICPEAAAEWDYEANGKRTPENTTTGTNQKFHWICSTCGYKYEASVADKVKRNSKTKSRGCPVCSGLRLIKGINDFETWCRKNSREDLLQEWDYEKNIYVKPDEVTAGNKQKVWWKGKCGHEWDMAIGNRALQNQNCPYCRGLRLLVGFNDFETWCRQHEREDLLKEWDYEVNDFLPSELTWGSGKQVFWKCSKCGYKWAGTLHHRENGVGCWKCELVRRKSKGGKKEKQ